MAGPAPPGRRPGRLTDGTYPWVIADADDDLVSAARRGGRPELEALLRSQHDRIYAVCRRLTGNDADAADATQEALVAVMKGLPGFDGRSRLSTWAYRIAVNASLDELRRRRRRPEPRPPGDGPDGNSHPGGASWPGARPSGPANDGIDAVALRIDVDAALLELTPEYRAAVVLRDLCGLDYAEIGDILDLPPGTVRSRIARGRAALVPLLSGNRPAAGERPSRRL